MGFEQTKTPVMVSERSHSNDQGSGVPAETIVKKMRDSTVAACLFTPLRLTKSDPPPHFPIIPARQVLFPVDGFEVTLLHVSQ